MDTVFLSAGHGGKDPGAVGNSLVEKAVNLNTLLECKSELERHNVKVVCSRTIDANDPVQEEVKEANASGAKVAVSFHINAGGGDGFEAYYYTTNSKGKKLASLGEKHVKAIGQNSRGLKNGNRLYFVKNTTMTAVLFESFFLDNAADKAIGDTLEEQKVFGVAYAKAILEFLGIDYKDKSSTKKLLTGSAEITDELNRSHFPITERDRFITELLNAKNENSPLYWGYYKLVNGIK